MHRLLLYLGSGLVFIGSTSAYILLEVPAVFLFPYHLRIDRTVIYSDVPIDPAITQVMARADRLLAASPINRPDVSRRIVLTNGGWRWRILAAGATGGVGLRRPYSSVMIFNRSSVAGDWVTNGNPLGGTRTLSGAIAHEMTHRLVALHIGQFAAIRLPAWKREGYADYVARETSLDSRDEARIRAKYPHAPLLAYYEGRRRVEAILQHNGGSVDALFDE